MEPNEQTIRVFDIISLVAIILGPILAVFVTRLVDRKREKRARRLEIFKTLMRTRGARLNPEHVGALNLIEIEYYKEKRVLNALEIYFQHLNESRPVTDTEVDKWAKASDHLLTKLLYKMAKSLGYEIEQLQILTGSYSPRGWEENEFRQTRIQERLISVLSGESPLFVRDISRNNPAQKVSVPPGFPAPPLD